MALKSSRLTRVKPKLKKGSAKSGAYKLSWDETVPRKGVKSAVAPKPYPASYAGKWIAWSPDGRKVVATSVSLKRVLSLALRAGYPQPIVERVPRNLTFLLGKSDS